jgi:hypothetical protein
VRVTAGENWPRQSEQSESSATGCSRAVRRTSPFSRGQRNLDQNFDKNIVHAARGVVVNDDAVQDFQGQKSPPRTIKI